MTGTKRKKKNAIWRKIHTLRYEDVKLWCVRRLPVLEWAPNYNWRADLLPDTVSGMMLAVQQVTQGLAFAVLSSVHPVFGLYGSLFPAVIYAIFGMGRHVATGTFALTSLISANAVERLVPSTISNFTTDNNSVVLGLSEFEMQRIGVAAAVSLLGGLIQVAMFVLHLGSATFLLTEPVISAMTTGAATHVVTSQVKYLLGMKMPYISGPLGFFYIYAYIFENIKTIQLEALLLSVLSIVILVLVKELNEKFKRKIKMVLPIDLVLIIATSVACYSADMEHSYGLDIVGHIPEGIPPPQLPPMNILSEVVTEAFGVALVGYVASLALARSSAKKFNYSVDDNQEFLAHGLSNVIPSFFFCIPSAAAMGRTALLYSTGAKTQCVLASIIVVGLKGMLIQFRDLKKYWNVDKIDWSIWVSTYVFTICFAANVGLLYGVVCTILIMVFRFPRARTLSLKQMKEAECRFKTESDSESLQQVKIISINNPLVFLNAKKFHMDISRIIQKESTWIQQLPEDMNKCEQNTLLTPVSNGNCHGESSLQQCTSAKQTLIFDCSGLTFFDYTGISVLTQIYTDSKKRNIDVLLANCKASLVKALTLSGRLESDNVIFFESVSSAIGAIQFNRNFCKPNEHTEV
ncbi:anion exchange transporter isoform X2 [Sceloporus undulatus]|uniref:anion exchange transporter isoform X2 n=1 Tax=Sceloporus undulatus TaxID=8520 RepID=UPI001C4AB09F|nr:anion exchange transporter isoform X2 [Sceloporus undulatus]